MAVVINEKAYERARKRLGLTHSEVARRTGVQYSTLRKWLTKTAFISNPTQDKLCNVLETPPDKLFKFEWIDKDK